MNKEPFFQKYYFEALKPKLYVVVDSKTPLILRNIINAWEEKLVLPH